MTSLLDNPFAVLCLAPSSPAAAVADRAREIGTPRASAARDALIAPRPRLEAEIAFLPGASTQELGHVLDALRAGRAPNLPGLSALAQANVLAHLATHGPCTVPVLRGLAESQSLLTPTSILGLISDDRTRAGMPQPNVTLLGSNIDKLRNAHAGALAVGAFSLGEEEGSRALCDFVHRTQPSDAPQLAFLQRVVAAWDRASAKRAAELLEVAGRWEEALAADADPNRSERLAEVIRAWGGLTAPQRLVEALAGLAHADSLAMAWRWRALGIDLANERNAPATALPIAEALAACFVALPELGTVLTADVEACRSLTAEVIARSLPELKALEAAIEVAELARDVLRKKLAGREPPSNGPKPITQLVSAFHAAAKRLPDDRAWTLLRALALKLHNEYGMTEAALSLTTMMLRAAHTEPEKITRELLEQIEDDWRVLRRYVLASRSTAAMKAERWDAALNLLDELISLEPDTEKEREWNARRSWVQGRITRRRVKIGAWAAATACVVFAMIVGQSGHPVAGNNPRARWSPTPPPSQPAAPASATSGGPQTDSIEPWLSREELRGCRFGELRIAGARQQVEAFQSSSSLSREQDAAIVAAFNNYLASWKAACVRHQYLESDQAAIEPTIAQSAVALRQQGAKAIVDAWAGAPPSVAETAPPTRNPGPAPGVPPNPFGQGRLDRIEWEKWFASLKGSYRAGANWWASVRSLRTPHDCNEELWAHGAEFTRGCLDAKARLDPSDRRRTIEPDYKAGWNSQ